MATTKEFLEILPSYIAVPHFGQFLKLETDEFYILNGSTLKWPTDYGQKVKAIIADCQAKLDTLQLPEELAHVRTYSDAASLFHDAMRQFISFNKETRYTAKEEYAELPVEDWLRDRSELELKVLWSYLTPGLVKKVWQS